MITINHYFYFYQGGDLVRFRYKEMLPDWFLNAHAQFGEGLGTVVLDRVKDDCLIGDRIPRM